jgi:hypothetical protein
VRLLGYYLYLSLPYLGVSEERGDDYFDIVTYRLELLDAPQQVGFPQTVVWPAHP